MMKLPEDQQILQGLLRETITLLCKNGLQYSRECSVEALIVVTLDQKKMFHTNIHSILGKDSVSDDDEDEEAVSSGPSQGSAALKRRRMQSDVSEVPSKRVVRLTRGEGLNTSDEFIQDAEEGVEYVLEEEEEEEEEEYENENEAGEPPQQFSQDLRNASQMSVEEYAASGMVEVIPGDAPLKTTDQEEVQVVQHVGMRLPTQPDTQVQEEREIKDESQPNTQDVVQIASVPPRRSSGQRDTPIAMATTRSGHVYIRGAENGEDHRRGAAVTAAVAPAAPASAAEMTEDERVMEQIEQGGIKADPADEETVKFIRELEKQAELTTSAASAKLMGEPEKLRKIISSAVDKVRKEVIPEPVGHVKNVTPQSAKNVTPQSVKNVTPQGANVTPVTRNRTPQDSLAKQAPFPAGYYTQKPVVRKHVIPKQTGDLLIGDGCGRGRPSNLPVTTTPRGTQVAVNKPLVPVGTKDEEGIVRVSSQPIKVLYGLSGKKHNKQSKICNTCGQMFTSIQSLSDHECGEKNLFQCGICSALFIRKDNLKKHFEEHREEVEVSVLQNQ